MEVMVLSTITGSCVGVLKMTTEETAIYDPITGRKKYVVVGMNYDEEFILPKKTTVERLAYTPKDGSMVYDTTEKKIYVGDGTTAGGVLCNATLYSRMNTAELNINLHETALNLHDARITSLENERSTVYVYGIDYDTSVATASSACKKVELNHTHDEANDPLRYTEVDDFVDLQAHKFRRCVMDNLATRHVNYYLNATDSTKKENGSASDLTGGDGDVMVEIPITYYRIDHYTDSSDHDHTVWLVSKYQFKGSQIHPFFYVGPGGNTARTQYVGAYRSTMCDSTGARLDTEENTGTHTTSLDNGNKMRSVAGGKPIFYMPQVNYRTAAGRNGGKIVNQLFGQYLILMMAIEGGTFDTQASISIGFCRTSAWNYAFSRLTGRCNFGNGTGEILADEVQDSSITWKSDTTEAQKVIQFQYRGIENPFGEIGEYHDGFFKVDSGYYYTQDDTKYTDTSSYADDYNFVSFVWPESGGFIKEFDEHTFLPISTGGSGTTYLCDRFIISAPDGNKKHFVMGGSMDSTYPSFNGAACGSVYDNAGQVANTTRLAC